MLEARILIIIKIQESRAQKNDKHIYRWLIWDWVDSLLTLKECRPKGEQVKL